MKKTYQKPEIVFENFSLSKSIATCAQVVNIHFLTPETCSAELEGSGITLTVFASENSSCQYSNEDALCYHVPNDTIGVFTS